MPSEKRSSKRRPRKHKTLRRGVKLAPEGSHPSQVSGMFQDDPTFEEFRTLLQQQRAEDYELASVRK